MSRYSAFREQQKKVFVEKINRLKAVFIILTVFSPYICTSKPRIKEFNNRLQNNTEFFSRSIAICKVTGKNDNCMILSNC